MRWRARPLIYKFSAVFFVISVMAWSPWLTEELCYGKVVEHLGGSEQPFNYLGETMSVYDVPKTISRIPFCAVVYFPGEAAFFVTFYGAVL